MTQYEPQATEALAKPFRLGIVGVGAAIGLFSRLAIANGYSDLDSATLALTAAAASFLVGLGLLIIAAERDRFGQPLMWICAVVAAAWGALNWISPPFASSVTVWSNPDQIALALVGVGNGLLLAGLVVLAFVRRGPTVTVGAVLVAAVATLASNTVLLRVEWPAIITLGVAFALVLIAWDRSPRREPTYVASNESPRISRAALSFIAVALCGTALQLWVSRSEIPRALPAVILAGVLVVAAFASMIRVRREIENRETTFSEWTSWMREIRTNEFRSGFETFDSGPIVGSDGEAPRKLSFPNLTVNDAFGAELAAVAEATPTPEPLPRITLPSADLPSADLPSADLPSADRPVADSPAAGLPRADVVTPPPPQGLPRITADLPQPTPAGGAFSAMVNTPEPAAAPADLAALAQWLASPIAPSRNEPLLVAIEAMSLDEFESLPAEDAAMARNEIGNYLADTMPDADLIAYIDGPYFIAAHASMPMGELGTLNTSVQRTLKATQGIHAFVRPRPDATLDSLVDEAVLGILRARQNEAAVTGRA